ncbi:hypothetical protein [Lysobacter xanthus]
MPRTYVTLACALALAPLLSACTAARVQHPASLAASATVLDVRGISPRRAGQPVSIGPYTAREVDDGGTFAWAVPLGGADVGRAARRYAFSLQSSDAPTIEVACVNRAWTAGRGDAQRLSVDLTRLAGPLLDCELRDGDRRGRLTLARTGGDLEGRLELPETAPLPVRSTRALEGTSLPLASPTGYIVGEPARSLMLVDVVDGRQVHLDPTVAAGARPWWAAAAAALLLSDPDIE